MAILDRIKKLFAKPKLELETSQLGQWLDGYAAPHFREIESDVKDKLIEAEHLIPELNEALDNLESAKLRNENIDNIQRNVMNGNRANYIRELRQLINWIEIPEPKESLNFCNQFIERINGINKSTYKNYFILQQFFADESSKAAEILSKMTKLITEVRDSMTAGKMKNISEAREKISELNQLIDKKAKLAKEIEDLNKKKEEVEKRKARREQDIGNMEKSINYQNIEKTILDLKDLNKKLDRVEDELTQLFSPLGRALRKFTRVGPQYAELIESYSNASKALMHDESYKILELLKAVRISIMKKELEIEDEEKIIRRINEITKEKLESYRIAYKHLYDKRNSVDRVVKSDPTKYQLNEMRVGLDQAAKELGNVEHNIKSMTEIMQRISTDEAKAAVQASISSLTDSEVTLK